MHWRNQVWLSIFFLHCFMFLFQTTIRTALPMKELLLKVFIIIICCFFLSYFFPVEHWNKSYLYVCFVTCKVCSTFVRACVCLILLQSTKASYWAIIIFFFLVCFVCCFEINLCRTQTTLLCSVRWCGSREVINVRERPYKFEVLCCVFEVQ
jgi:hypothetical protein